MTSISHRFGRFEIRPAQRTLLVEGQAASLGGRAFDVLLALIERRDRVVASSELFELVWPGLVVEENNLRQQIAALRKVLGADSVLTIPGRGYRFAFAETTPPASSSAQPADSGAAPGTPPSPLDTPSIAVLPFSVLSEESRVRFLADGLVEDVIALLARVPGFMLISRGSSFEFRNQVQGLGSIARQLGVRYVVEGSVRPVADGLRVSTQLVEAATGHVLWSGTVDARADHAADLQEAIARGIITELEPELTRAEISLIRRQRPDNVDAWGHYRQAVAAIAMQGWTETALHEARLQLRLALAVDPSFALARAHLGLISALGVTTGLLKDSQTSAEAIAAVQDALELDDGDPQVLGFAGCALADLGQHESGTKILQRALELDPSNAQAHVALGATQALQGQSQAGIERMRYGMRISPRDRRLGFWGWALGLFLMRDERIEESLQAACESAARDPRLFLSPILQAASLLALGRTIEAREALAAAYRLRPSLTLAEVSISHGNAIAARIAPLWRVTPPSRPTK